MGRTASARLSAGHTRLHYITDQESAAHSAAAHTAAAPTAAAAQPRTATHPAVAPATAAVAGAQPGSAGQPAAFDALLPGTAAAAHAWDVAAGHLVQAGFGLVLPPGYAPMLAGKAGPAGAGRPRKQHLRPAMPEVTRASTHDMAPEGGDESDVKKAQEPGHAGAVALLTRSCAFSPLV